MGALKLVIVDGPSRGKEFPLEDGETFLGRTNETEVELPSNKVSRRHAVIRVGRGNVEIEDLGSSNGTYLNGKKITKSAVPAGGKIVVGEYVLQVFNGGKAQGAAPATGQRPAAQGGSGKAMVVGGPQAPAGRQPQPRGPQRPGQGQQRGRPTSTGGGIAASEGANRVADQVVGKMGGIAWRTQVFIMAGLIGVAMMGGVAFLVSRTKGDFRELALGRAKLVAQQFASENAVYMFQKNNLSLSNDATSKQDGVKEALIAAPLKSGSGEVIAEIAFPASRVGNQIDDSEYATVIEALKAGKSFDVVVGPNKEHPDWFDIAAPMQYYNSADPVDPGFKLVGVAFITFDPQVVADKATSAGLLYGVALAVLVLSSLGGALLVIRATEPAIARLQEDTELVIRGDLKQVRATIKMPQLEALVHSINRLIQKSPGSAGPSRNVAEDMAAGRAASPALALPAHAGPVDNAGASATVRAVVSAIEDAIIVVDAESNVVEVNRVAEKMFGLIPARVRGKHLLEAITDQDLLNTVLDVINEVTAAPDGVVQRDAQLPGGKAGRISAAGVRQGNELAGAAIVFKVQGGG